MIYYFFMSHPYIKKILEKTGEKQEKLSTLFVFTFENTLIIRKMK